MDRICSSASCRCSIRLRSGCQVRALNSLSWFLDHSWAVFAVWRGPLSCWRGPLPSRSAWSLKSKNLNLNWAVFILTPSQSPPRSGLEMKWKEAKKCSRCGIFLIFVEAHFFQKCTKSMCLFSLWLSRNSVWFHPNSVSPQWDTLSCRFWCWMWSKRPFLTWHQWAATEHMGLWESCEIICRAAPQ